MTRGVVGVPLGVSEADGLSGSNDPNEPSEGSSLAIGSSLGKALSTDGWKISAEASRAVLVDVAQPDLGQDHDGQDDDERGDVERPEPSEGPVGHRRPDGEEPPDEEQPLGDQDDADDRRVDERRRGLDRALGGQIDRDQHQEDEERGEEQGGPTRTPDDQVAEAGHDRRGDARHEAGDAPALDGRRGRGVGGRGLLGLRSGCQGRVLLGGEAIAAGHATGERDRA